MARDIKEISVAEKRGLEPLIRSKYNKTISELRDTEKHDIIQLVGKIAKKFKIGAALLKMKMHRDAAERIKKSIIDLGFELGAYDNSVVDLVKDYDRDTMQQVVDYKKPAGKIYYNITKARPDIASVEKQRDTEIANLWLSTHKTDVKKIIDKKIEIPKLQLT